MCLIWKGTFIMSIFDRDRIGNSVYCLLVKDDTQVCGYVKWTQAYIGQIVEAKMPCQPRSKGWTIVALDVIAIAPKND